MKLYIMKRDALEILKANLLEIYGKYYTDSSNEWIYTVCGENPFVEFRDIAEFSLENLDSGLTPGEIDLNNCKILYEKLMFLSESQASDERLWAGLTHTIFYEYMRKRWGYANVKKLKSAEKEIGSIKTRFFYKGSGRHGFYRNTLSKCWWVGHNTYNPNNFNNHFENLDIIGSNDFSSKVTEFFYNFTFSSNPEIMSAIIDALNIFRQERKALLVRNHIRPAMSYLNALGGSVVIDCLSKKEITDIFYGAINAIMQGNVPSLSFDSDTDEEDTDDLIENENDFVDANNLEMVTMGCKVFIRNSKNETKKYIYGFNDKLTEITKLFTGHKVGDVIKIGGEECKIERISF